MCPYGCFRLRTNKMALREPLVGGRIHTGEPDNGVRTCSTRYLTANSTFRIPALRTAAQFGGCWRRLPRLRCRPSAVLVTPDPRITGRDGRTSPFRVLDLPVSSPPRRPGLRLGRLLPPPPLESSPVWCRAIQPAIPAKGVRRCRDHGRVSSACNTPGKR